MRAVPELSTLFRSLPPSLHATALRARHPSIDAAHTLTTTLPDGITAAHTARAAAALPHLTSLSLTVRGYRFTSRLASFQRVLRALGDVPCAVALSVADALPWGDLPALVLRQHLAHLRHMTRLAISPNSLFPGFPPFTAGRVHKSARCCGVMHWRESCHAGVSAQLVATGEAAASMRARQSIPDLMQG